MTSELKPSDNVTEFVNGGKKNYACQVIDTEVRSVDKTVCKVRGITLNYHAAQLLNFKVIRDMILGKDEPSVNTHIERIIKRKLKECGGMVS